MHNIYIYIYDIIIAEEVSLKISAVGTHNKSGQTRIYKQTDEDWNPEPADDTTAFLSSFNGLLKLSSDQATHYSFIILILF